MKPVAWRQSLLKQKKYPTEKDTAHFHQGFGSQTAPTRALILYMIQATSPLKTEILIKYTCKIHTRPLGRRERVWPFSISSKLYIKTLSLYAHRLAANGFSALPIKFDTFWRADTIISSSSYGLLVFWLRIRIRV